MSRVIAASVSVSLARAAFEEAVKQWPDQKLTLRQEIMLISEHPSPSRNPRKKKPATRSGLGRSAA
jgi:hypothetical protein